MNYNDVISGLRAAIYDELGQYSELKHAANWEPEGRCIVAEATCREVIKWLRRNLIGDIPTYEHPDSWLPRARTWIDERANWSGEVNSLRKYLDGLRSIDDAGTFVLMENEEGQRYWAGKTPGDKEGTEFDPGKPLELATEHWAVGTIISAHEPSCKDKTPRQD